MPKLMLGAIIVFIFCPLIQAEETPVFQENFNKNLKNGWIWVREDPEFWRLSKNALEIRVQPGNMWGKSNNARNVLVRPAPDPNAGTVVAGCTVENAPTHQYEQVNLVWYYDDSNMVKIGLELVHGQMSLVMGREEKDRTVTLSIIPLESNKLDLRLTVTGDKIHGQWRYHGETDWREGGKCTAPGKEAPKVSIQCYQGPEDEVHWARITEVYIEHRSQE